MGKFRLLALMLLIVLLVSLTGCEGVSTQPVQETTEEINETYPENWPKSIVAAGGVMGGPWYPLMVKYSEILMREIPGLNVNVIEGGSLANCRVVNEGINAQIGLSMANTIYEARSGQYDSIKMTNILATNAWMDSIIQLMVPKDSKIMTVEDTFDKRIGSSTRGGGPDVIWQMLLEHYGKTYDDVRAAGGSVSFVNYNETATLLKDGHLDVGSFQGECPHAAAMETETSVPLRPIEIQDEVLNALNAKYPFIVSYMIPKEAYKGMDKPVQTVSTPVVMIVNKDLPEDFVYELVKISMDYSEEICSTLHYVTRLNREHYKDGISDEIWHPMGKRVYDEETKK